MTSVSISDAALKELAKKYLDFKYIAIDSSPTAYDVGQTGPLQEVTSNGGQRAMGTATHDSNTGKVTITKQFVFTGSVVVKAICPMNSATAGQGTMLCRFIPESGSLPEQFGNGGSLLVTFEATQGRPE